MLPKNYLKLKLLRKNLIKKLKIHLQQHSWTVLLLNLKSFKSLVEQMFLFWNLYWKIWYFIDFMSLIFNWIKWTLNKFISTSFNFYYLKTFHAYLLAGTLGPGFLLCKGGGAFLAPPSGGGGGTNFGFDYVDSVLCTVPSSSGI